MQFQQFSLTVWHLVALNWLTFLSINWPQYVKCTAIFGGLATIWRGLCQTMPHDNLGTPNFLMSGTVLKLEPCHPQCGCQMQVGWVKIDNFRQIMPQPGAATVCVRRFFSCHPVVFSYPDTIRYDMLLNDISGIFLVCLSSILLSFATVIQQAENAVWVRYSVQLFADYCNFHIKRTMHA